MRAAAIILLAGFLAVLLAPAFVVADFWIERGHIEQELCVQRMVVDGQRTCHGECYLMKQLRKTEQREKGLPTELRAYRLDDMAADRITIAAPQAADAAPMTWPILMEMARAGHPSALDPVPWC
jgi:hypothetical protein